MLIEFNADLSPLNTFGLPARAERLIRLVSPTDIHTMLADPELAGAGRLILGGGSNVVLTGRVLPQVCRVEISGITLVEKSGNSWIVEAGAGETWDDLVRWTLDHEMPGLENLALIPGSVGAAPVQNIGAYGVELADRFHSLDVVDLETGNLHTMDRQACCFAYRDSLFKHQDKLLIVRVRLNLPRPWRPVCSYPDLKDLQTTRKKLTAQDIYEKVCEVRHCKLPNPEQTGNAGSFFKNPIIERARLDSLLEREPNLRWLPLPDGRCKVAAGWLIEACGWKGRTFGRVGVHSQQALVLVNHGGATGAEVLALAELIQAEVSTRFGLQLEPEPLIC